MSSLRQVKNDQYEKRASHKETDVNGNSIEVGWMSSIRGVVADTPDKIRGDRVELIILEEAGSWSGLMKAVMQAEALINVGGQQIGSILFGGTGGDDSGHALDDLRKMYYDPQKYNILPFRHNFTPDGSEALTGYFLPSFSLVLAPGFLDERGWCDPVKAKEFYQNKRDSLAGDPKGLLIYCAEHCFTAEEAFALEGENKFNKIIIAEQLTRIRALKQCPQIEQGYFTFTYKSGQPHKVDGRFIQNVIWKKEQLGHVRILEHPAWLLPEKRDPETNELLREKIPIQNAMYVAGVDGIDIGAAQTSKETKDPSDFCIVIYKRVYGMQDPQIVAIYKDRPQDLREAYQQAIALAMYYNARINIEATRMSFVTWAKGSSLLNWFMKRPRATYQDITKVKTTAYGTPATAVIINHQTDLIADFVEDYGYNLWFEEVLEELNLYSDENKRKFDIIASLGMALLADEELNGVVPRPIQNQAEEKLNRIGYYTDENGYKRFGVIPDYNRREGNLTYNPEYYDDSREVRSSNPRVLFGGLW